jgi:hypothetical protein
MTDSTFTRGALKQIAAYPFQMGGVDGERLKQWLEAFRNEKVVAAQNENWWGKAITVSPEQIFESR